MNRGIITVSESGTVSMPTDTVWMTMQEIADMYNVFGCYVRKAVKAIFKDGILKAAIGRSPYMNHWASIKATFGIPIPPPNDECHGFASRGRSSPPCDPVYQGVSGKALP